MSSTYAPVPFSYLAAGSQAPKTGFRKDEGLYGNRRDMAKPIPALRHDLPRTTADSIDHRLRCADSSPTPEPRRPRDVGDTESSLSQSNLRLPRSDVSLYQSQIDGPVSGNRSTALPLADTPSGHYSNQSPSPSTTDVVDVSNGQPASAPKSQGMFDNFILLGPGIQSSQADSGARRTDDERPPSSRLEQLFDTHPSSSDVAPTGRQQTDVDDSRPPHTVENGGYDDSMEPPRADQMMTNSFTVTTRSVRQHCRAPSNDIMFNGYSRFAATINMILNHRHLCCSFIIRARVIYDNLEPSFKRSVSWYLAEHP